MAGSDAEKSIQALHETFGVLLPKLILQENAHGVHADRLTQPQFSVIDGRIEGGGLEHLKLVDSVRGNVVCADKPRLASVPGIGRVFSPAAATSGLSMKQSGNIEN